MIAIVPCEFCGSTGGMDLEWKCVGCKKTSPSKPIPMLLHCPECHVRHIDEGKFATKAHHTHACQSCGCVWRPAIVSTVGVRFLPGFKNDEPPVVSPFVVPPLVTPIDLRGVGGSGSNEWETCALARFFRDNPNEKSVNLYCGCPKCSPSCAT